MCLSYVLFAATTAQRVVVKALDFLVGGGVTCYGHGLHLSAHQTFALNNGILHFYEHVGVAVLQESLAYSGVDAVLITTLAHSLAGT